MKANVRGSLSVTVSLLLMMAGAMAAETKASLQEDKSLRIKGSVEREFKR